jgi:thiamine kinase-like enzyme
MRAAKVRRMTELFAHPAFRACLAELECQGVGVSSRPAPGADPYAVVAGRSNERWWLVPLHNSRIAASGLALFQPVTLSARLMKLVATSLSLAGLRGLWARRVVYVSGEPAIGRCFRAQGQRAYAFFTGTNSPHRKTAVQVMDRRGRLLGFAKLAREPAVNALLRHEAAVLEHVSALALKNGHLPELVFSGFENGCGVLATDTAKTMLTRTTTRFTQTHRRFLQELTVATSCEPRLLGEVADRFASRLSGVRAHLDNEWANRLDAAVSFLYGESRTPVPLALSHGDFTPSNTFLSGKRLYVFDWEYAEMAAPIGTDLIHFVLNQPGTRRLTAMKKLAVVSARMTEHWTGISPEIAPALLIAYLLTQCLRQIERQPESARVATWQHLTDQAELLDLILVRRRSPP